LEEITHALAVRVEVLIYAEESVQDKAGVFLYKETGKLVTGRSTGSAEDKYWKVRRRSSSLSMTFSTGLTSTILTSTSHKGLVVAGGMARCLKEY
jgi:hypothetical protein